jgi:hypothetical protein
MRRQTALWAGLFLVATVGGIATLALSVGQPPSNPNDNSAVKQVSYAAPAAKQPAREAALGEDPAKLSEPLRAIWHSAHSGAEWLMRMDNPVNGRFHPGWIPDLNTPIGQDRYLSQAGAARALAKAARYFGDDRYLMKARQAVLSLLADTQADSADPTSRTTNLPPLVVNRAAAAGMLLMIIHELQSPAEDLLKQGEELCQYIRKQQQADGSIRCNEPGIDPIADSNLALTYSGWALYGLVLSARNRPAPWKLEVVSRALPYYRSQWKSSSSLAFAAAFAPTFAEAFVQTRLAAYADFVFEISDWLCALQYSDQDAHATWVGGFKGFQRGIPILDPPSIATAAYLEALTHACLVTRHVPDAARYAKYRETIDSGIQFLSGLQYTEGNTLHFTTGYRPILVGGFHASLQDGSLRLDNQYCALIATVQRLAWVGDR